MFCNLVRGGGGRREEGNYRSARVIAGISFTPNSGAEIEKEFVTMETDGGDFVLGLYSVEIIGAVSGIIGLDGFRDVFLVNCIYSRRIHDLFCYSQSCSFSFECNQISSVNIAIFMNSVSFTENNCLFFYLFCSKQLI